MNLKFYFMTAKQQFITKIAYPFHTWAQALTMPFIILVLAYLWIAVYQFNPQAIIGGFSLNEMIAYYIIGQIVILLVLSDWMIVDLGQQIRKGSIILALIKPISFLWTQFAIQIGNKLNALLLAAIPILLITVLFFGIQIPNLITLIAFASLVFIGFLISFFIASALTTLTIIFRHEFASISIYWMLGSFLSGDILPLNLYPEFLKPIVLNNPFQFTHYVPVMVWLGKIPITFELFLSALIWVIISYLISKLAWTLVLRRITIQGG